MWRKWRGRTRWHESRATCIYLFILDSSFSCAQSVIDEIVLFLSSRLIWSHLRTEYDIAPHMLFYRFCSIYFNRITSLIERLSIFITSIAFCERGNCSEVRRIVALSLTVFPLSVQVQFAWGYALCETSWRSVEKPRGVPILICTSYAKFTSHLLETVYSRRCWILQQNSFADNSVCRPWHQTIRMQ